MVAPSDTQIRSMSAEELKNQFTGKELKSAIRRKKISLAGLAKSRDKMLLARILKRGNRDTPGATPPQQRREQRTPPRSPRRSPPAAPRRPPARPPPARRPNTAQRAVANAAAGAGATRNANRASRREGAAKAIQQGARMRAAKKLKRAELEGLTKSQLYQMARRRKREEQRQCVYSGLARYKRPELINYIMGGAPTAINRRGGN